MFTPIPPRIESAEKPEPAPSVRRSVPRRGSRLRLVTGFGIGCIALGTLLRLCAHIESGLAALFYSEFGTWLIGFGVLVVALCLVEWARRDRAG